MQSVYGLECFEERIGELESLAAKYKGWVNHKKRVKRYYKRYFMFLLCLTVLVSTK